jgi:ParB-like chromosome segregation protein Spo0J
MTKNRIILRLRVDEIVIPDGRRELQRAKVDTLVGSMDRLGPQSPIGVRMVDGKPHLVYGLHRLCAARELEWDSIDCWIIEGDDRRARLAEISENLHRAELTALEEAEQVAEWIRLVEELQQEISARSAQKSGPGRPEGGLSAAAREIGVNRDAARRAQKIAALPMEAKAAARELGLADNQAALLKAAKSQDPILALHQHGKRRGRTSDERPHTRLKGVEARATQAPPGQQEEECIAESTAAVDRVATKLIATFDDDAIAGLIADLEIITTAALAKALRERRPEPFAQADARPPELALDVARLDEEGPAPPDASSAATSSIEAFDALAQPSAPAPEPEPASVDRHDPRAAQRGLPRTDATNDPLEKAYLALSAGEQDRDCYWVMCGLAKGELPTHPSHFLNLYMAAGPDEQKAFRARRVQESARRAA